MTSDELHELARLSAKSAAAGDRYIDELAKVYPRQVAKAGAKQHLLVERKGSDPTGSMPMVGVANLAAASCLGREIRKLRKSQEGMAPPTSKDVMRVPQEIWVVQCESNDDSTEPHVDVRALACLRLLQPSLAMRPHQWLVQLARAKLSELMVAYPALLHPRLLWAAAIAVNTGNVEALPLAHAIARTSKAALPTPANGVSPAFEAFATHPAVTAGITCRAPITIPSLSPELAFQGSRLGVVLGAHPRGRVAFLDSLLRLDRVRRECGALPTLLTGSETNLQGYRESFGQAFAFTWTTAPADIKPLHTNVLAELRMAPLTASPEMQSHLLEAAVAVVTDPSGVTQMKSGVKLRVEDQRERYERLVANLTHVGAFATEAQSGLAVMRRLLPLPDEPKPAGLNPAVDVTKPETALACIEHWLVSGAELNEVQARVAAAGDDAWERAIASVTAHRTMSDVIQRGTTQAQVQAGEEEVPRPRRAMRL